MIRINDTDATPDQIRHWHELRI
nr:hypothetical protein [Actinomadura sp. 6K520]